MMMRIFAALALIGLAIAMTAYFFVYAQPGDWLYTHKDWLGIVSSLIAIATFIATLMKTILNKEKTKALEIQTSQNFTAGGDMVFGDQNNTINYGSGSSNNKT